ncbi:MAG: primosomal protein N' [Dehalococcoidia bacterium]|nr:primosomal protein N' [Dehalococcoidia bacterium]
MRFAEVAVDAGPTRRTFSYSIPEGLKVTPGQLVRVPFGSRLLQGIVFQLRQTPAFEPTKDIAGPISSGPVLSAIQLSLATWIGEYYLGSLFTVASLMLPPDFRQRIRTYFSIVSNGGPPAKPLTTPQALMFQYIMRRKTVDLRRLEKAFRKAGALATANQLVRKGLLIKVDDLESSKVGPKLVKYVSLIVPIEEMETRLRELRSLATGPSEVPETAFRQRQDKKASRIALTLESLASSGGRMALAELRKLAGATAIDVKAMERDGLVVVEDEQVFRDPLAHRLFPQSGQPELTLAQESIWANIEGSLAGCSGEASTSPGVFLLHGITGSGKTEIYLRSLALTVKMGRQAIVMVPEIALTPQTVGRFVARFPGKVAVLHSRLSPGEQYDEWQRIRAGEFDVVIGSRSAIFAPLPNLGLIVLDEEHEWTYKQTEAEPRYHTRDVAIKLAGLSGAAVILGSATPDIASYYKAKTGQYKLIELSERITSSGWASEPLQSHPGRLSLVQVVDLRQELRAGNRGIFSRALLNAVEVALAAREQVILFLNRRGTATFVNCRDCGFVMKCKRCATTLTYHSAEDDLICHLCNYRAFAPDICPTCLSPRIRYMGVGTQKVEEEAGKAFPGARLLRWDRDSARRKGAHEEILDRFTAHEADILIGTQMVAKGLDLPKVTLVGIVCADIGLHLPDFRASEHTFQILTQVAGRAGRGILEGKTIIQTYSPEHYAIVAASHQDFLSFYSREIKFRSEQENPPFSRLAKLLYAASNDDLCRKEANRVGRQLKEAIASEGSGGYSLVGPAPAYISRLRGRYRWQVVLRGPQPQKLIGSIALPGGWTVDIDPVTLL